LEKLAHLDHLEFDFHYAPFQAENILHVKDLSFHFDEGVPLIQDLSFSVKSTDRIAIIGKNGKGKSTLLNLLAEELKPVQGEIRAHDDMKLGYFGQTNINRLQNDLTVEEEILNSNPDLGRTVVRGICGTMMFSGDNAEKRVAVLSGGEKSRVLLGKILAKPANLIFLDEPTNHLDMESIEALVESLEAFEGAVLIVTHSEMILKAVANRLVVFQHGNAELFNGTYEEFLDRQGWEEEEGKKPPKPAPKEKAAEASMPAVDKNDLRKKRAELINRRSKTLNPLKQEMESLEKSIALQEGRLNEINQELIQASQANQVDVFVRLSKSVKELQKEIDLAYSRLDRVSTQHDEKSKAYEDEFQKLDGESS
jgi:ATP-binding cassette subfamily F protein 3